MTESPLLPAVILAGGAARRMGEDKAELMLKERTLLQNAIDRLEPQAHPLVISRRQATGSEPSAFPVIGDHFAGFEGPLAGISSALCYFSALPASHMLSVAVDTPFFPADLADRMMEACAGNDEIVVAASAGKHHPVFALWPLSLGASLATFLAEPQNRKVMDFIGRHTHQTVDFDFSPTSNGTLDPFFNINTPEDLNYARQVADVAL